VTSTKHHFELNISIQYFYHRKAASTFRIEWYIVAVQTEYSRAIVLVVAKQNPLVIGELP
jgi:hypothetical protein